jgi:hypothetical protein
MKIQVPEELKSDVPHSTWGKLLVATPVIMTVISTMLAGLASSEMTRAQYDRAYAAQLQSKAGDQWNYFQAKRLRSALQRNSIDLIAATADVQPFAAGALQATNVKIEPSTLDALTKGTLPILSVTNELDVKIKAAIHAVEDAKPEPEINEMLTSVPTAELDHALRAARDNAGDFDDLTAPINQAIDQLEKAFSVSDRATYRSFAAARIRYSAARYDAEAKLNQAVANLLELQVRKSNFSAERHHRRSGKFFFGMLAAQAAVIVSTFSLAAQKRNFLWSVAAAAGLIAIAFAIYVYLYV